MIIYIGLYLLFSFFAFLEINYINRKKIKLIFNMLIFLLMISIFSLSYTNGGDWSEYQKKYDIFNSLFDKTNEFEVGYNFIVYLSAKVFSFNFEVFRFLVVSICIYFYIKIINQYSKNTPLTIAFMLPTFFFINLLEPIIRQLLASLIFFYSLKYLKERKNIKYLICIIIGSLFHKTIIILSPLILLKKRFTKKKYLFFLIVMMILQFYFINIIEFFIRKVPILFSYEKYLDINELKGTESNIINYLKLIFKFIILNIPIYFSENNKKLNEDKDVYNYSCLYVLVLLCSNKIFLLNRIAIYFIPFYFILISNLIENIANRFKKNLTYFFYFLFYLVSFINLIYKNNQEYPGRYLPYNNYIWEQLNNRQFKNLEEKLDVLNKRDDKL
ncbi:MAG: EpsG family protein [Cetobacterium sp.]